MAETITASSPDKVGPCKLSGPGTSFLEWMVGSDLVFIRRNVYTQPVEKSVFHLVVAEQ